MRIGNKMQKEIGVWNYGIDYGKDYSTMDGRAFTAWCFKLTAPLIEGCMISPDIYKGFRFQIVLNYKYFTIKFPKIRIR